MIILITVTGVCFAMPTNKDVVKPASPREKNLKWFRGAAKTGFIGKLPMKAKSSTSDADTVHLSIQTVHLFISSPNQKYRS